MRTEDLEVMQPLADLPRKPGSKHIIQYKVMSCDDRAAIM